ncbi:MAG TPA: hypothetical protein VKT82_17290 [Ktedonobacterales bacterium]|nr:hypothetical protein [Ktedonobacterales bacterium]
MAEQEPKVTPIIRLPQIRAARTAASDNAPGLFGARAIKDEETTSGTEETEALLGEDQPLAPLKSQISGAQKKVSSDTAELRAGISSILRRALLNFAEQERQRAWLVTALLATQAALLLVILPGYLFSRFQLAGVLVTAGGLGLFGIAWLLNWMGRTGEASFLLVVGGEALVVLDVLLSAAHLVSLETLHIALLFLLVILSGGILFSPETALILASLSAIFTALVLLLFRPSGELAAVFAAQGRYLSLVYLVLIQVAVGVVAWLFGRQMQESVHLITYVSGLQMTNKRLLKRLRETDEKKRHLETGVAIIQQTHARVAAGDYSARAHVEGELLPLAVSLNLMLERVESFVHGEHERERMETAVAGLAELAGRVGQESQGRLPVPTGTALDGLSIAIKQMQTNVNQRLAKVQRSATALMTTVSRCQENLLPVAEVLEEHLRNVDALVIAADHVMSSAQRQIEFATQAEQLLLAAAPEGVDLKIVEEPQPVKGTSALRLAEEMERRLANKANLSLAAPAASGAAQQEPLPSPEAEVQQESLSESAAPPDGAVATPAEQVREEQAPEPAETAELTTIVEESTEPEAAAEQAKEPEVEAAPPTETPKAEAETPEETSEAAAPAGEQQDQETPPVEEPAPVVEQPDVSAEVTDASAATQDESSAEEQRDESPVEEQKVTLADVDREAAEEEQPPQELEWNVAQLRELVQMLSTMAGEATQQERHARTLSFKLRLMLEGMPNTRRVDMVSAWLGAALEAVSQSAMQVQQESKIISTRPFQPPRKERDE